jgi:hypothetical protein
MNGVEASLAPGQTETVTQETKERVANIQYTMQPPPGYVLIPEKLYQMLLREKEAAAETPNSSKKPSKKETVFHLRVLRPMHLGDIKTNINPGEKVSYVPTKSITIRGRKHDDLGSFLNIWNSQWPGSPRYNPGFEPVFEVDPDQKAELEALIGGPRSTTRRSYISGEQERINREESRHSRGNTREAARSEGVQFEDDESDYDMLPPSGSDARKDLITQACLGQRKRPGHEQDVVETVDSFATTRNVQDYRVVAKIPGRKGDEGVSPAKRRARR